MTIDPTQHITLTEQKNETFSPLIAISTLALLLSPWALIGLVVSMFTDALLSTDIVLTCALMLLAAMPKLLQLLIPQQQMLAQNDY